MAVTIRQQVRTGANSWRVSWTSDLSNPTYRVFVNGRLVYRGPRNSIVVSRSIDETFIMEVLDNTYERASYASAPRAELQFLQSSGADHYKIEINTGAGYAEVGKVAEDRTPRKTFRTPVLPDSVNSLIRLTPVGTNGNNGTASNITGTMVRHADVPQMTASYGGGVVVVGIG